jgi:hypothetical protein
MTTTQQVQRPKRIQLATPEGTLGYPFLQKPSTKFNPEGVYSVDYRLSKEKASELIEQIDAVYEEGYKAACLKEKKAKLKRADKPYKDELDKVTGEETGNIIIKFKLKAAYKAKDGSMIPQRPLVIDSRKQPVVKSIGSGSTGRVAFDANPYCTPALGFGLSLRLRVVQIINLVEYSGLPGNPMDLLGEVEDGFVESESTKENTKTQEPNGDEAYAPEQMATAGETNGEF